MQLQPAEALHQLRQTMHEKSEAGELSEFMMHSFLRQARQISPTLPDRDAAEGHVWSQWRRFDAAEAAAERLISNWGETHYVYKHASMIYANALCYEKAVSTALKAAELMPGSVDAWRMVEHMTELAGAFTTAMEARKNMRRIGVPPIELGYGDVENEYRYLKEHNITDAQVTSYHQAHIDIAKQFIGDNPNILTSSRRAIEVDPETGNPELWFDICLSVSGKMAAQIEWEMSGLDLSCFPENVRNHVFVGVRASGAPVLKEAVAG